MSRDFFLSRKRVYDLYVKCMTIKWYLALMSKLSNKPATGGQKLGEISARVEHFEKNCV